MNWLDSVNEHMTLDEAVRRYPALADFFQELGFRDSCRDCALATLASRIRLKPQELVARANEYLVRSENRG